MKLELGKKYIYTQLPFGIFECIAIYENRAWMKITDKTGPAFHYYDYDVLDKDFLPYEEPVKQEWKTFLIETLSQKTNIPYRFVGQYCSIEDVRKHHKQALSITEIKLNFETV